MSDVLENNYGAKSLPWLCHRVCVCMCGGGCLSVLVWASLKVKKKEKKKAANDGLGYRACELTRSSHIIPPWPYAWEARCHGDWVVEAQYESANNTLARVKDKFVAVCDKKKKKVRTQQMKQPLFGSQKCLLLVLKRLFAVGKKMQGCKLSPLIGTELLVRYQRDELCRRISSKAT